MVAEVAVAAAAVVVVVATVVALRAKLAMVCATLFVIQNRMCVCACERAQSMYLSKALSSRQLGSLNKYYSNNKNRNSTHTHAHTHIKKEEKLLIV